MHATQVKTKLPYLFGNSSDCENYKIASSPIVKQPAKKQYQYTMGLGAKAVKVVIVPTVQSCPYYYKTHPFGAVINDDTHQQLLDGNVSITKYDDIKSISS